MAEEKLKDFRVGDFVRLSEEGKKDLKYKYKKYPNWKGEILEIDDNDISVRDAENKETRFYKKVWLEKIPEGVGNSVSKLLDGKIQEVEWMDKIEKRFIEKFPDMANYTDGTKDERLLFCLDEIKKAVSEKNDQFKALLEKLLEDNNREIKKEVDRQMSGFGWKSSKYGECIWVTSVTMLDILKEKLSLKSRKR